MKLIRNFRRPRFMAMLVMATALFAMYASSALASGGVAVVHDSGSNTCDPVYTGSPCFGPPNVVNPGDNSTLLVTIQQATREPNMTITLNTHSSDLSFVSSGDGATSTVGNKTTVTLTDAAHGYKSVPFVFHVSSTATPGETFNVSGSASTADGSAGFTAWLQVTPPVVVPPVVITPASFVQVDNINACASVPVLRQDASNTWGTFVTIDEGYLDAMTYQGVTFTYALYVQGFGATCNPPAGSVDAGYKVDSSGTVNPAAQDNIYPYYVPAGK